MKKEKPYSREDLMGKNFILLTVNCKIIDLLETEWDKIGKTYFYRVSYKIKRGRKIHKLWVLHRDFIV